MLSSKISARALLRLASSAKLVRNAHYGEAAVATGPLYKIGKREIVGPGVNGTPIYADLVLFPFPAIRYKENTPDIAALREKEKGDWSKLSTEEKKALYRASFCQTFAEMQAPTGEWKSVVGIALFFISLSLWYYMAMVKFVYYPLPITFDEEHQAAQLRRMLDLHIDPIDGLSSKWDYEKDDWKK